MMPRRPLNPNPWRSRDELRELAHQLHRTAEYANPERARDWLHNWLPNTATATDPERAILSGIASAAGLADAAEQLLRDYVAQAREQGMSWREIGESCGITRQAAQQRFGGRAQR